jgi:YVTN family beta-propeller protein
MIDLSDHTVVADLPVGGLPTGCAVGRAGRHVYAALSESDALAIVDVVTGDVRTVPVGAGPSGVAAATKWVYVANRGANTVSVVDPRRANVVGTIAVGDGPFAVAAEEARLYVVNQSGGTVSVIDTNTRSVVATIPVGTFPAGLALHTPTRRLYVANFLDGTVSVIDTLARSVLSTLPVVRTPRALAVDAAGQRLFVAGFDDGRVQVIDTGTGAVTLEASSGGLNPVDLMFGPRGRRLYVAHLQETQGVVALDPGTLAPVAAVNVPAGPLVFAGLGPQRPRAPLTRGWPRATRVLSAQVRAAIATLTPARRPDPPSLDGEVVITDTDFLPTDWAVSVGGPVEFETSQQLTGGNPGAWRRMTHFGPATIRHRLVRPGQQYTPASQGPIVYIDASWDRRLLADAIISERFLVEQDNVVYETTELGFFSPAWENMDLLGLVADDFVDASGGHPDFSATGSTLRFGYSRSTVFGQTVTHGIDNFVVTVRTDTPPANLLGFVKTFDAVDESDAPFVWVRRRHGSQGAVSVDVVTERPNGSTVTETLSWADGDGADKSLLVLPLDLPQGSGARTAHLRLQNPTGGASIDPSRDDLAITVFPEGWPEQIRVLFLRLQALLGAFPPIWLIALAMPAAAMAARRWRHRQTGA